jgi:hypothetical protein
VLLSIAICVWTLGSLASVGEMEGIAMLAGRLLFLAAIVLGIRAALGVRTPRLALLARTLLVVIVVAIAALGLPLVVGS